MKNISYGNKNGAHDGFEVYFSVDPKYTLTNYRVQNNCRRSNSRLNVGKSTSLPIQLGVLFFSFSGHKQTIQFFLL